MARILIGMIAVIASVMLADSLTCNSCTVGLLGYCMDAKNVTCTENGTESCYTVASTFPSIKSFNGFSSQGCKAACANSTTNSTLAVLGTTYSTKITCCSTDKCNEVVNGAPTTKLSLTAALGAAVLASVWGTMMY